MNTHQLKHVATVLNAIAFAQLAVFGYTGLNIGSNEPTNWIQIAITAVIFVNLEVGALRVLSKVPDKE